MKKYLDIANDRIPLLGLGTWEMNGEECMNAVEAAIHMGYRHLDTAQMYKNEAEVGKGMKQSNIKREELFLTTKVSTDNLEPAALIRSTEKSLKELKTDYIDLLLIHWPTPDMDMKESLSAMFRLKDQGKIKHAGVSNFSPAQFREAIDTGPVICNQIKLSPYTTRDDNLYIAKEKNLMITAYSPLGRGKVIKDTRLQEIGKRYNKNAAQVALRWLLQLGNVSVIPKSSKLEHLHENIEIFDFELSREDMKKVAGI